MELKWSVHIIFCIFPAKVGQALYGQCNMEVPQTKFKLKQINLKRTFYCSWQMHRCIDYIYMYITTMSSMRRPNMLT